MTLKIKASIVGRGKERGNVRKSFLTLPQVLIVKAGIGSKEYHAVDFQAGTLWFEINNNNNRFN